MEKNSRFFSRAVRFALLMLLLVSGMQGHAQVQPPVAPAPASVGGFTGYFNITDMGLLIGSTQNQHPAPFSFMTINGWHLTEQVSAGVGVGVEFLSGSYLPLVLDARYYVRNTPFSPFFYLQGGYAIPLDDERGQSGIYYDTYWPYPWNYEPFVAQGGWLLNPGFGIRHLFGENFGVNFSVGYRVQRLRYEAENGNRQLVDYNRLALKVGITFR